MAVTIWIPGQADPSDVVACPVCHELGVATTFRLPEQLALYERHFDQCAARNRDELYAKTVPGKAPKLFGPESGDVELREWIAAHRVEILEDRKKL